MSSGRLQAVEGAAGAVVVTCDASRCAPDILRWFVPAESGLGKASDRVQCGRRSPASSPNRRFQRFSERVGPGTTPSQRTSTPSRVLTAAAPVTRGRRTWGPRYWWVPRVDVS